VDRAWRFDLLRGTFSGPVMMLENTQMSALSDGRYLTVDEPSDFALASDALAVEPMRWSPALLESLP
jgi:hypothetical protein